MNNKLVALSRQDGVEFILWTDGTTAWQSVKGDYTERSVESLRSFETALLRLANVLGSDGSVVFEKMTAKIYIDTIALVTVVVYMTKGHWLVKSLRRSIQRALRS